MRRQCHEIWLFETGWMTRDGRYGQRSEQCVYQWTTRWRMA